MAVETLVGVETGGGGGGAQEVKIGCCLEYPKYVIFPYFGSSGRLLVEGLRAFQDLFFLLKMKKNSTMTFLQGDCLKQYIS